MKSSALKKWNFFKKKWIAFLGKFIMPLVTLFLGLSVSLLPTEYKEMGYYKSLFLILIVLCIVFAIMILIYVALAIYDRLENQILRYAEINDYVEDLAKAKAVYVESVSQNVQDNIKSEGERIKDYYTSTTKFIDKAEKSIIIFDYLGCHATFNHVVEKLGKEEQDLKKAIINNCTEHYKTIASHFEHDTVMRRDSKLRYTRILMFPISCPSITSPNMEFDITNSPTIRESINQITLEHIEELFKKKKKFKGRIHFRILPFPITNFSFGIIDNKKLLLELDYYNIIGKPLPNHLFIIHDDENGNIVKPFKSHFLTFYDKAEDLEDLEMLDMTMAEFKNEMIRRRKRRIEKSLKNYT